MQQGESNRALAQASWIFWLGIFFLLFPGLLHAWLLMPFPGSQDLRAIEFSWYLERFVFPLRLLGILMVVFYAILFHRFQSRKQKWLKGLALALCLFSYYFTDIEFSAQHMFKEPRHLHFASTATNKVPLNTLVVGIYENGAAKAYPLNYLGYHHKIQDNIDKVPVLVTYCTMCRSARVYSPMVDNKREVFRLVGARHYNAILEDKTSKSWWYQATGVAAAGPMKGHHLLEIQYEQGSLSSWIARYPQTLILQPDGDFLPEYKELEDYDHRQPVDKDSTIRNKDSLIAKSWVLGVLIHQKGQAWEWRSLFRKRLLNDSLDGIPLLIAVEKDSMSFHVWNRTLPGAAAVTRFVLNSDSSGFLDVETHSNWNWEGRCTSGTLAGSKLLPLQSHQEYWRSWKHFHPESRIKSSF